MLLLSYPFLMSWRTGHDLGMPYLAHPLEDSSEPVLRIEMALFPVDDDIP